MCAGQSQEALQRTSSNSESRTPAPGSVAGTALSAFRKALWITGCCPTTTCQGPHSPCREEVTQPQGQSGGAQCSLFMDEETECVPWLWTRERECLTAFLVSGSLRLLLCREQSLGRCSGDGSEEPHRWDKKSEGEASAASTLLMKPRASGRARNPTTQSGAGRPDKHPALAHTV